MVTESASLVREYERIDRILTLVEHIWKVHREWTFAEVAKLAISDGTASPADDEVEVMLRAYLRTLMGRQRDDT